MKSTIRILVIFGFILSAVHGAQAGVDDLRGKEWRQLTETTNVTWNQAATICPQDGVTPCVGSIANKNFTDWVWADQSQVIELLSLYVPEILTSPDFSVGGADYFDAATNFFSAFNFTRHDQGCVNYSCFNNISGIGITASAILGEVYQGVGSLSSLFWVNRGWPVGDPGSGHGVWLWRPTGLGTGAIYAYDDVGQPTTPFGGLAVNVLANDWIDGQRATAANVTLTQLTPASAGVTLLSDGSVMVATGTPAGTYILAYRICAIADASNCDDAVATVTVASFILTAVNDQASVSFYPGGIVVANVLANDTLGGLAATTAVVTLRQVSSTSSGVSLNSATGAVSVAPATANGTYTLVYEICEIANLANCKQATVTLTPYSIDAVNDVFPKMSSKTGGTTTSVLVNDRFNGTVASTTKVNLALLSTLIKGITFNLSSGTFTIKPKTRSGTYTITYQICEIASPTNCDSATATLDLSGGL